MISAHSIACWTQIKWSPWIITYSIIYTYRAQMRACSLRAEKHKRQKDNASTEQ